MKLCIAEKPSVASDIARVIGATSRKDGYFEGNGYYVTWVVGHVLEIGADELDTKWDKTVLPIIPKDFQVRPLMVKDKMGAKKIDKDKAARVNVIKGLMSKSDTVINCGDAGREGELIQREVLEYLNWRGPVKRLWISSLTDSAIRDGFANLHDASEFDDLAAAARSRTVADLMIGANATRALSLTVNGQDKSITYSVGRVQSVVLKFICERYIENTTFVPTPYWVISGIVRIGGHAIKVSCPKHFEDRIEAEDILARLQENPQLVIEDVKQETKPEKPPLLYDLTTLEKEANAKFGMTATDTDKAMQGLYEKKMATYPRTGCRFISRDVFATVPKLMKLIPASLAESIPSLAPCIRYKEELRLQGNPYNERSVDDTKLTDHHAIIITGENFDAPITSYEKNIFSLIVKRFVEAFAPECSAETVSVSFSGLDADIVFETNAREVIDAGWRAAGEKQKPASGVVSVLGRLESGDTLKLEDPAVIDKMTEAPPILTDATTLNMMEKAGELSDDKEIKKKLKGVGIGTPATRAETIERLVRRGFVKRINKDLLPTATGEAIYQVIKDMDIANVALTAEWEGKLEMIADGKADVTIFRRDINEFTKKITNEIMNEAGKDATQRNFADVATSNANAILCPKCKKPMRLSAKAATCDDCNITIWKSVAKKELTDNQFAALVNDGKTGEIKGFMSKAGKPFSASLELVEEEGTFKTKFVFTDNAERKPQTASGLTCPKCGASLVMYDKVVKCPNEDFKVWREVAHKKLTDGQLKSLIVQKRLDVEGLTSKAGKKFSATLVLDDDGKVSFNF